MNKTMIFLLIIFSLTLITPHAFSEKPGSLDLKQIENLTGVKGEFDPEFNVFKVFSPRTDLKVTAAGVKLTPALGLTSWASFKSLSSEVEMRGDIVLFEDQINLIMQEALDHGLNITALHNHYLWDTPRIMFMHIEGKGNLKELATAVGKVFEKIKRTSIGTLWKRPLSIINPEKSTLNSKNIEEALGKKGAQKEGVTTFIWGTETKMNDSEMGGSRGVNTWVSFAGTDREAVMLGDIAMKEGEVQNVLKSLLKHNIFIISLHQHMKGEAPRLMGVHYMGRGSALELAKVLKETLEFTPQ